MTPRIRYALLITALTLALVAPATSRADYGYSVTDLGDFGGYGSYATGINNLGQVVGYSYTASGALAFLYDGTGMHSLGTLGGSNSAAYGINDAGQIVGYAAVTNGYAVAFLYDATGMHNLGALPGDNASSATGINASGVIVGSSSNIYVAGPSRAFIDNATGMHDLGSLAATGINDAGQVVGAFSVGSSEHALLYDATGMHDLGTLGGLSSVARAINDAGQIVGSADLSDGYTTHAFLHDSAGMHDLGTLGGYLSDAFGINSSGLIVGVSRTAGNDDHAFLYRDGAMVDLNSLISPGSGWILQRAQAINNQGQIVGYGTIDGHTHAFLLTPQAVPEPSSIILMSVGALSSIAWLRRTEKSEKKRADRLRAAADSAEVAL